MTIALSDVLTIIGLSFVFISAMWAQRLATGSSIRKVEAAMFTNIQRVELNAAAMELRLADKYATNASLIKVEGGLTNSIEGLRTDMRELRDVMHPLAHELRESRTR